MDTTCSKYINIAEDEEMDPEEYLLDNDNTLPSTVLSSMPGSVGICYINEDNGKRRCLRVDNSRILPPPDGWKDRTYFFKLPTMQRKGIISVRSCKDEHITEAAPETNATASTSSKRLSKRALLAYIKEKPESQVARNALTQWNKLNAAIRREVYSAKWNGNMGVQKCHGTTEKEALENQAIRLEIASSPAIKAYFKKFHLGNEGTVELDHDLVLDQIRSCINTRKKTLLCTKPDDEEENVIEKSQIEESQIEESQIEESQIEESQIEESPTGHNCSDEEDSINNTRTVPSRKRKRASKQTTQKSKQHNAGPQVEAFGSSYEKKNYLARQRNKRILKELGLNKPILKTLSTMDHVNTDKILRAKDLKKKLAEVYTLHDMNEPAAEISTDEEADEDPVDVEEEFNEDEELNTEDLQVVGKKYFPAYQEQFLTVESVRLTLKQLGTSFKKTANKQELYAVLGRALLDKKIFRVNKAHNISAEDVVCVHN